MKHITLLLSLFIVSLAAAQKPLDRGIHKRKTGGVSFLFGKEQGQTQAASAEPIIALSPLGPADLVLTGAARPSMEASENFADEAFVAVSSNVHRTRPTRLRPLNRKGLAALVRPRFEKRMLQRSGVSVDSSDGGGATYDWASITGSSLGVLALLLIDSSSELMPLLWLLGFGFSLFGLSRTKNSDLRGRGWANFGIVLFCITPLVILVGVVAGWIDVF